MKAWLKGGLIGAGIGLVWILLAQLPYLQLRYFRVITIIPQAFLLTMAIMFCGYNTPGLFGNCNAFSSTFILILITFIYVIVFFILGVIVGDLVNKIKIKQRREK